MGSGIVRRLDSLGRIVIPKEIRDRLNIKENEPMEIDLNSDNKIILQKFDYLSDIMQYAESISNSIVSELGCRCVIICDNSIYKTFGGVDKDININYNAIKNIKNVQIIKHTEIFNNVFSNFDMNVICPLIFNNATAHYIFFNLSNDRNLEKVRSIIKIFCTYTSERL